MRTGLFGGTFNPVHTGHITISEEIKAVFGFGRMIIVPSSVPPHKRSVDIADADHRFEMTLRAFGTKSGYSVSDVEIKRRGPSYTVDTVDHFKKNLKTGDELYFLLGMDAFLEIDTWMSYTALFARVPMVVMTRPGYGNGDKNGPDEPRHDILGDFIRQKISAGYYLSKSKDAYEHESLRPIYLSHITPVDISATDIRDRIRKGKPVKGLIPESVEAYIMEKGLYQ